VRFNECEVLITNIVRQSRYDTPIFSATVYRKIIIAPLTGTQQLLSYCSSFCGFIVFGELKPLFLEDSQQNVFCMRWGWTFTSNPQPGGPEYPFSSESSTLTCRAWETLPVATILPV